MQHLCSSKQINFRASSDGFFVCFFNFRFILVCFLEQPKKKKNKNQTQTYFDLLAKTKPQKSYFYSSKLPIYKRQGIYCCLLTCVAHEGISLFIDFSFLERQLNSTQKTWTNVTWIKEVRNYQNYNTVLKCSQAVHIAGFLPCAMSGLVYDKDVRTYNE